MEGDGDTTSPVEAAAVPDTTTTIQREERPSKKRKNGDNGGSDNNNRTYWNAYKDVTYRLIPSTGQPGSPHRYFQSSYEVSFSTNGIVAQTSVPMPQQPSNDSSSASDATLGRKTIYPKMRVHQHANGLCIVCLDDSEVIAKLSSSNGNNSAKVIKYAVQEIPDMSLAEKRKRSAKQLKGKRGSDDGAVRPSDTLVSILSEDDDNSSMIVAQLPCCVFGSVIELNHTLTTDVLRDDPLLNGYLAIIQPSGVFPPPDQQDKSSSIPK